MNRNRIARQPAIGAVVLAALLIVVMAAIGPRGHGSEAAQTQSMQVSAIKDNTLYEDPQGATSNGAGNYFFAGKTDVGEVRRGLVAFDVEDSLPAGATVTGVTLTLNMSRTNAASSQAVELHRVLAQWGEGDSHAPGNEGEGAPAAAGTDATWLYRFYPADPWTQVGGDFASAASATAQVGDIGTYTWSSAQMVADVQSWLDNPSTNFGWLVKGNEATNTTTKRFDTKESGATHPFLSITFTPPTETGTPTPTLFPYKQGDTTCDTDIDVVDAIRIMRYSAGLKSGHFTGCPDMGAQIPSIFGDLNCDSALNSSDALALLRYLVGLPELPKMEPCPDIGQPLLP